jgi:hypothetical protein
LSWIRGGEFNARRRSIGLLVFIPFLSLFHGVIKKGDGVVEFGFGAPRDLVLG